MNRCVLYKDLPKVCDGCRFHESESQGDYSPNYHYCTKGLFLPTKSNKCKVKDNPKNKAWWQKARGEGEL